MVSSDTFGRIAERMREAEAEVSALRTRAESAERERDEAYAKGQMDMKEAAEEAAIDTWSWDEAIKAIRNLPIKERP